MGRMAEEERMTALRDEVAWAWHLEREQDKREREEKDLTHQRRVAESQRRFKKQVCTFLSSPEHSQNAINVPLA